jgi:Fe2+ transport system protein FeoA
MMRLLTNLTELKDGQSGIIVNIDIPSSRKRIRRRKGWNRGTTDISQLPLGSVCVQRLMDLGLTPGTKVVVVKSAPFKGPLEVLVRSSRIVLGREIASRITIEVI